MREHLVILAILFLLMRPEPMLMAQNTNLKASQFLGNPEYPALCYGGYRNRDRSQAPDINDIEEDLVILQAMGIKVLRTYHARLYNHAENLVKAIKKKKAEDPTFEMYVMLGCWMQCEGAWTEHPNHQEGDDENNQAEILKAVELANTYPDIVKIIAVGNESMVHWASSYFVEPGEILHWVKHLQGLKKKGALPDNIWITSSDNYASWGGEKAYHSSQLEELIKAVDYLSVHSYPFHDTHYNPEFWLVPSEEEHLSDQEKIARAMDRALDRVDQQVSAVREYMQSLGLEKEIHLGETGWASGDASLYSESGSRAADPYKQFVYYKEITSWCEDQGMTCFYFEAFDEPWKDQNNPGGSENHFGIFNVDGRGKLLVQEIFGFEIFTAPGRNAAAVGPASAMKLDDLREGSLPPPRLSERPVSLLKYPEGLCDDPTLIILDTSWSVHQCYPPQPLRLNAWDGSCNILLQQDSSILIKPQSSAWWGAALEPVQTLDLESYEQGILSLEIRGQISSEIEAGMLSGNYALGTQKRLSLKISSSSVSSEWTTFLIAMDEEKLEYGNISGILFLSGQEPSRNDFVEVRRVLLHRK